MKKFKLITALLSSALILAGCNGEDPKPVDECDHVMKDTNQDGTCDSCQKEVGHADADNNGKCDYCGKDMQEPAEPTVKSVSIEGKVAELEIGKTVDLTANIVVENGAAQGITWSVSNDNASLSATSGKNVTVTALKAGKVTVKAASTFDPTKFDEVEIEVKEPEVTDWSDADKQLMETKLGIVLPFFKGDFEWYESRGSVVGESENADDVANAVAAFDALDVEKVDYGSYIEYTLDGAEEGFAVIVKVGATSTGAMVLAYSYRCAFPSKEIAEFIGEHSTDEIPEASGDEFELGMSSTGNLYVDITGGDIDAYAQALAELDYDITDLMDDYGYYDCQSPSYKIELILFDLSEYGYPAGSFELQVIKNELIAYPSTELAEYIGEWTEETVPVSEGKNFAFGLTKYGQFYIDVYGGNLAGFIGDLETAGYDVHDYSSTSGYFDARSAEGYLEVVVFPMSETSYELQVYLTDPPEAEFPSEVVLEYIGDHSTDTVPAAEGTGFENFVSTSGALCINVTGGDEAAYIAQLVEAGYTLHEKVDLGGEGYMLSSPSGDIDMFIWDIDAEGTAFQIQLILTEAPELAEFPTDNVAAFTETITAETVIVPEADGFDDNGVMGLSSTYYEVVVRYSDAIAYADALEEAGWLVSYYYYQSNSVIMTQSPEGYLQVQLWDYGSYFEMDIYLVPQAAEFPLEELQEFLDGCTDATIPTCEADKFEFGDDVDYNYNPYFYVCAYGGDAAAYCSALEDNSFVLKDSGDGYWVYLAADSGLEVDVHDYGDTGFEADFYALVKPAAGFPSENIAEFIGDHSDTVVPAAEGETIYDSGLFYDAYEVYVQNGDINAYIEALGLAGFTFDKSDYNGDHYLSEDKKVDVCLYDDDGSFYIDIYLVEAPEPAITEWPAEQIADALGEKAKTTVPECDGTSYDEWYAYEGGFSIFVYDADYDEYVSTLLLAGFTQGQVRGSFVDYISEDQTVVLTLCKFSDGISISGYSQNAPEEVDSFPIDQINTIIGIETGLPSPESGSFELNDKSDSYKDVIITVTDGNMDAYLVALSNAGYTSYTVAPGTYSFYNADDVYVDVTPVGDSGVYTIEITYFGAM